MSDLILFPFLELFFLAPWVEGKEEKGLAGTTGFVEGTWGNDLEDGRG